MSEKEKMYLEYQKRYKEYKEKHKKVEKLQDNVKKIQAEGQKKKSDIESQKKDRLGEILQKKKNLEKQLASIEKDGKDSSVFIENNANVLSSLDKLKADLQSLQQEKNNTLETLKRKKTEAVSGLENDKELCQKRLDDLMNGGDGSNFIKKFDEVQLRQKLDKDKEIEIEKLSNQMDLMLSNAEDSLKNIDNEYDAVLQRELSYVEQNTQLSQIYSSLDNKAQNKELPQVITDIMADSTDDVIQRNNIDGGQKLAQIANNALYLDDLSNYTPQWLVKFVDFGLPSIVTAGILLFFILSGLHMGFVATATNAVASFLIWVAAAAILGGIAYGIIQYIWDKGIIGGIVGAILGFWIATHWSVTLPDGVTNIVEWIIKCLICLIVGVGLYFLNTYTGAGNALVHIGMKIGFIKKQALLKQGELVQANIDSYYVLIKYKEIIEQIVNNNKEKAKSDRIELCEKIKTQKVTAINDLSEKLSQEAEDTVSSERSSAELSRQKYEQQQINLIQMQDECMTELFGYDGRIQEKASEFDEKINETTLVYDKKITNTKKKLQDLRLGLESGKDSLKSQLASDISDCDIEYAETDKKYNRNISELVMLNEKHISDMNTEIRELQDSFKKELDGLNKLFAQIYNSPADLKDTKGVLSDVFYIFNEKKENKEDNSLTLLHEIRHEKNPIVFLYEKNDSSKMSEVLPEFMKAVMTGLLFINCNLIYKMFIMDPISEGINFQELHKRGILTLEKDINQLEKTIGESMRSVAEKCKNGSIDQFNAELIEKGNDEDEINNFGKYNVVQFIVPEEESVQTTDFFNNAIWSKFETSKKYGFLPIFYINKNDWESALNDQEKFNSKFIMKLNKTLGSNQGNIYVIDTKNISVSKYNK